MVGELAPVQAWQPNVRDEEVDSVVRLRTFLVTFHKVVLDGRGRDRRVLQQQTVVPASFGEAAADAAKVLFCQTASIVDWRMRADTCEVTELAI